VNPLLRPPWWTAYSFVLVTAVLFLVTWFGQFFFEAVAFVGDQDRRGQVAHFSDYLAQFAASTLANWQAEFLQLVWQAVGLGCFYHWGSSQSRERTDRLEAKVDALLRRQGVDPDTLR
jgi:hypothetical protein